MGGGALRDFLPGDWRAFFFDDAQEDPILFQ